MQTSHEQLSIGGGQGKFGNCNFGSKYCHDSGKKIHFCIKKMLLENLAQNSQLW